MRPIGEVLLRRWHNMLGLARQSPPSWYRDRVREELRERRSATTTWQRLSETADVFFSISRARHDGFPVQSSSSLLLFPRRRPQPCPHPGPRSWPRSQLFAGSRYPLVCAYMLVKYTSRWAFYRSAAFLCNTAATRKTKVVSEVVNPAKDHKLHEVALRHGIDPVEFVRVGRWLRMVWPLLP